MGAHIAEQVEDRAFARACQSSFQNASIVAEQFFWSSQNRFFRSWVNGTDETIDALHTDTLYGQLWSRLLDLGDLVNPAFIAQHLEAERKHSGSEYGLLVMFN